MVSLKQLNAERTLPWRRPRTSRPVRFANFRPTLETLESREAPTDWLGSIGGIAAAFASTALPLPQPTEPGTVAARLAVVDSPYADAPKPVPHGIPWADLPRPAEQYQRREADEPPAAAGDEDHPVTRDPTDEEPPPREQHASPFRDFFVVFDDEEAFANPWVARVVVPDELAQRMRHVDARGQVEYRATTQEQIDALNRHLELRSTRDAMRAWLSGQW
jgi:hypothetical protein